MIFYEIHSHTIFAENLISFREIAHVIAIMVKHDLAKSKFQNRYCFRFKAADNVERKWWKISVKSTAMLMDCTVN